MLYNLLNFGCVCLASGKKFKSGIVFAKHGGIYVFLLMRVCPHIMVCQAMVSEFFGNFIMGGGGIRSNFLLMQLFRPYIPLAELTTI